MGLSDGQLVNASLLDAAAKEQLLASGEENRRPKLETATHQQDSRAPNQPYGDLTKDTDSETPRPRQTLQYLTPDSDETTQQERREAQWTQNARELGEADYIHRYYAEKLGLVGYVEMYKGLSDGQLVNASLLDAAAKEIGEHTSELQSQR